MGDCQGPADEPPVKLPVVLRPEAEQDVESARRYYEQQAGSGRPFVEWVSEALERNGNTPEL